MICHFYAELQDSDPLVWRRIVVPVSHNLHQLHMALQGALGWENSYLFQFCENDLSDPIGYGVTVKCLRYLKNLIVKRRRNIGNGWVWLMARNGMLIFAVYVR